MEDRNTSITTIQPKDFSMFEESRRFTRIKYGVSAIVTVDSVSFSVDSISNLGIGGVLIPCEQKFDHHTKCIFQIPMTGSSSDLCVEVKGEFVWSNGTEAAIKFTGIDPDSLMLLQNIIKYNAEDPDTIECEIEEHQGII